MSCLGSCSLVTDGWLVVRLEQTQRAGNGEDADA